MEKTMLEIKTTNNNYKTFAEYPIAATYFKYIDILIKKDLGKDVQHLMDIAHAPLTEEIQNEITEVMAALNRIINENTDYTNEFIELSEEETNNTVH